MGRLTDVEPGVDHTLTSERRHDDNDIGSSAFLITAPPDDLTDDRQQPNTVNTTSSASTNATTADMTLLQADYNATNVDLYFRTAHLLHYASIVILGLFVLQVRVCHTVSRKMVPLSF